jgi:hypothetical protein
MPFYLTKIEYGLSLCEFDDTASKSPPTRAYIIDLGLIDISNHLLIISNFYSILRLPTRSTGTVVGGIVILCARSILSFL